MFLNLLHDAVEAEKFQEAALYRDYTTRMEAVDLLGEALDVGPPAECSCAAGTWWCMLRKLRPRIHAAYACIPATVHVPGPC